MARLLTISLLALTLSGLTFAQKRTTIIGDAWTGKVVATDDDTREITIKNEGKGKMETFMGFLIEGYKVRMKDGNSRELRVSEIPSGSRIRVFYKTKERLVGGSKAKVNIISRIDFLGGDEFGKLRDQLNLPLSTPVSTSESNDLPAGNPLKVCLAVEDPKMSEPVTNWVNKWNKGQAQKYGLLEIVSDVGQSDVCIVVYKGVDTAVVQLPIEAYDADGNAHRMYAATAYVVAREGAGLKVLLRQRIGMTDKSEIFMGAIEKEFEKKMKARAQPRKK